MRNIKKYESKSVIKKEKRKEFYMSNNKCVKKVLSLLVAIMIIVSEMPLNVLAEFQEDENVILEEIEEDGVVASGYLDSESSVEWKLIVNDDVEKNDFYNNFPTYTMEISGSGAVPDFEAPEDPGYTYFEEVWPWYQYVFEYSGRNQSRRTAYITRLIINDGITGVGANAFWAGATTDVYELSIADSVEYIGKRAFQDMSSLEDRIILPASLKKVDEYAFSGSYNNKGIVFTGNDTVVCAHAFDNCAANSKGQTADLKGVTSLGEGAFNNCYSLVEVKNTGDIKTVGKDSFRDCQQLEKISLPGISSIPDGLFYNCYKLKSFEINGNITEIGTIGEENDDVWYDGAFYNCWELSNIEIPKSVISIGNHTFDFCTALSSVIFESGRSKAIDIGTGAFANCYSLTSIKLPEGMTKLSAGILAACPIESIELPSSIRVIEDDCFSGNESLKSITLHEGLESIGERAFCYCTNLETVNFPSSLRSIGEEAFRECKSLKNLVIPSGMTEVPGYIYNNCESAETIVIPDSVTIIGDGAFTGCKNVKELKLPKNLKSIGKQAFQNVNKITELSIPSSVEIIDEGAFAALPLITSVVIPDKVEELSGTFSGCTSLAEVKLPTGLKKIGKDTFMMCYPLKIINLSETQVTEIGDRAFGVDSYNAFKGNQLTDIKLPETLKTIGTQAFDGCIRLESIVLPESVESIGDYAFGNENYSMKLKSITIGEKVISLGEDIFLNCPDALTIKGKTGSIAERYASEHNINFESTGNTDYNPVLESGSIDGTTISWEIDSKGVLTVKSSEDGAAIPDFEVKYMYADTPWVKYSEIIKKIVVEDSIEVIGICAFRDLESVKSVELPENLKKIRLAAFAYCKSLEEITLPEGLTALGSGAFAACYKLKSINIPGSITSWCEGRDSFDTEDGHFTQCKSLKEVTIPSQLSKIYSDMFSDCTSLEKVNMHSGITEIDNHAFEKTAIRSIDIPEGLTRIGYDAFGDCEKLVSVVLPESLNNLGVRVFADCTNLENVVFLSLAEADDITCYPEVFSNNSDELSIWIYKDSGFAEKLSDYSSYFKYIEAGGSCGTNAGYVISESKDMLVYGRGSIDTASIDLSGVKTVYISEFITSISDTSFAGYKDSITIHARGGSYAAAWAKENGFAYVGSCTHSYATEYTVDVEPTCTEPGSKSIHCIYCGEKKDITVIKALGHSWDVKYTVDKTPTCEEAGTKSIHCTICSEKKDEIIVPARGHDYVDGICSRDGVISLSHCKDISIDIKSVKFNEAAQVPEVTVTYKDKVLNNGIDYILSVDSRIAVGTYEVVIEGIGKYGEIVKGNWSIFLAGGFYCEDIPDQTYTGTAIKPEIQVYSDGKLLEAGIDYTISYGKYNTNVATKDAMSNGKSIAPSLTITGKGNYSDKQIVTFNIVPRQIDAAIIQDIVVAKGTRDIKISPVVALDGKNLKYGTDYVVSTSNKLDDTVTTYKESGTYNLWAVGKNNYAGAVSFKFIISEAVLASKVTITKIPDQNYDEGRDIEPAVEILYNKENVTDQFEVTYDDNSEIGTASVLVTAKEGSKFVGSKKATFKILGEQIKKAKLGVDGKGVIPAGTYSGEAYEPELDLYVGSEALRLDVDYTVKYEKQVNVGTATAVVTGVGKYTGSKKFTYKIKPYDAAADADKVITINGGAEIEVTYEKGGTKPKPVIEMNGKTLVEKKDYTLRFANNKDVADQNAAKAPTITIIFKGNFTGKKPVTFTITKKDIGECTMIVADKPVSTKANTWKQTSISIVDTNGKKLAAKKDYDAAVKYYSEEECLNEITTQTLDADTVVYVKAVGLQNYEGTEIVGSYHVSKFALKSAKVVIADQIYTGKEICPEASSIQVTIGKNAPALTADVDYEIVEGSFKNNINKGKARVTIRGIGDYYGTKVVTFKIKEKGLTW